MCLLSLFFLASFVKIETGRRERRMGGRERIGKKSSVFFVFFWYQFCSLSGMRGEWREETEFFFSYRVYCFFFRLCVTCLTKGRGEGRDQGFCLVWRRLTDLKEEKVVNLSVDTYIYTRVCDFCDWLCVYVCVIPNYDEYYVLRSISVRFWFFFLLFMWVTGGDGNFCFTLLVLRIGYLFSKTTNPFLTPCSFVSSSFFFFLINRQLVW